ncbi:MAG: hypothetical protein AB1486_02155 [Planctomycetota bacterium]
MSSLLSLPIVLLLTLQSEAARPPSPLGRVHPALWRWTALEQVEQENVYRVNPADIAINANGGRHLVFGGWSPGDCGPDIYWCGLYHQFSPDGQSWSEPELIPGTEWASSWSEPVAEADETGRLYVAWIGAGVQLCWSDDQGLTFSPPVQVSGSLPTGFDVDMQIDARGAVHLAWLGIDWNEGGDYWWDVYYAWSTPTYFGGASVGAKPRDPVFYPGYAVSNDHDAGGGGLTLAVRPDGWVTTAWTNDEGHLRIAQAYAGDPFPPPWDPGTGKVVRFPWAVSHDDGALTILYERNGPPDYAIRMYSLIARDGRTFEGPFAITGRSSDATLSPRRCVHSWGRGWIHVVWTGYIKGTGRGFLHSVSYDYGRSLSAHTLLWDYQDYPPSGFGSLDLLPDGRPALICYLHRYGEAIDAP